MAEAEPRTTETPPTDESTQDVVAPNGPTSRRQSMASRVLQIVGIGIAGAAGIVTAQLDPPNPAFLANTGIPHPWPWVIAVGLVVLIAPYIAFALYRWIRDQIRKAKVPDIIGGTVGLIIGSLIALLLTVPLAQVRVLNLNVWLPLLAAILFGYLGTAVGILRRDELGKMVSSVIHRRRDVEHEENDIEERASNTQGRRGRHRAEKAASEKLPQAQVLVDTSAIIDGRIADISQTGFIMGTLVVPRFVLEELQHIADSADTLRRNRGRRGLDILNRLQKETNVPVEITDADFDNVAEVDAKLVKLARQLHAPIITNDFNLNKVAELQGIKVLNINELANAVKPALLPGEDMDVKIIQEGKEINQGVGYLDDGTMIVVEGGKAYMNSEVEVTVTRVLQTVAGRMIFAQPKQTMTGARRSS